MQSVHWLARPWSAYFTFIQDSTISVPWKFLVFNCHSGAIKSTILCLNNYHIKPAGYDSFASAACSPKNELIKQSCGTTCFFSGALIAWNRDQQTQFSVSMSFAGFELQLEWFLSRACCRKLSRVLWEGSYSLWYSFKQNRNKNFHTNEHRLSKIENCG